MIASFAPGSAPGQTSAPRVFGITNAAGGILAGRVAPGELIAIYGLHFGPAMPISATFSAAGFLPTSLGGVQVRINGISAPLLYVSDTQINAVAPVELVVGSTSLQMSQSDVSAPDFRLVVDPFAPQVFRYTDGSAIAINQDGTLNSPTNPAKIGSTISVFATGVAFFAGADGRLAAGRQYLGDSEIHTSIDGRSVPALYTGASPGMVNGVAEIDFQVTSAQAANGRGNYLVVGGNYSNAFTIFVTQ